VGLFPKQREIFVAGATKFSVAPATRRGQRRGKHHRLRGGGVHLVVSLWIRFPWIQERNIISLSTPPMGRNRYLHPVSLCFQREQGKRIPALPSELPLAGVVTGTFMFRPCVEEK